MKSILKKFGYAPIHETAAELRSELDHQRTLAEGWKQNWAATDLQYGEEVERSTSHAAAIDELKAQMEKLTIANSCIRKQAREWKEKAEAAKSALDVLPESSPEKPERQRMQRPRKQIPQDRQSAIRAFVREQCKRANGVGQLAAMTGLPHGTVWRIVNANDPIGTGVAKRIEPMIEFHNSYARPWHCVTRDKDGALGLMSMERLARHVSPILLAA